LIILPYGPLAGNIQSLQDFRSVIKERVKHVWLHCCTGHVVGG
jgi:hypothetical protein